MSRDDSPLNNSRIWSILFTQPSAVCETAAKWIDSRARLQCRFFPNLSRRNNRSHTGPQTLSNFWRNGNRQWISDKFHVYSRYLAATRDIHSTTTGCKWLIFRFTTMMQRNQSAHTAWPSSDLAPASNPLIRAGKILIFANHVYHKLHFASSFAWCCTVYDQL